MNIGGECLERLHRLCSLLHRISRRPKDPPLVSIRVFLAAYMIAYRPSHVFESMDELETALYEASKPLLTAFERLISSMKNYGPPFIADRAEVFAQMKAFPSLLFDYLNCFKAWKVPDEAKLTKRIQHALTGLYQARRHLPEDEPESSALCEEFRLQIEKLRAKYRQIAGAAELARFDKESRYEETKISVDLPTDSSAGARGGSGLPGRMTNEQLAHELMLDPEFQLLENGGAVENPAFSRIRASFHQAFWDSLVDDLELSPVCFVRVLRVLAEIRSGIEDLASAVWSSRIVEVIDLDLIKQQIDNGAITWEGCVSLIDSVVGVIMRVHAPKRDKETTEQWNELHGKMLVSDLADHSRLFCDGLSFLLGRVNVMRIDAANARLRLIAPVIMDHGVPYEAGKLQDKLDAGDITLERAEKWIQDAINRQRSMQPDFKTLLENGNRKSYILVHTLAMVNLVTTGDEVLADNVSETLAFDVYRLQCVQNEFRRLVLASSMLVKAVDPLKTVGGRPVVMQMRLQSLADYMLAQPVDSAIMSADDIEMAMNKSALPVIADIKPFADTLSKAFKQCAAPSDMVHQLMQQRMRTLVVHLITENNKSAGNAVLSGLTGLLGAARMLLPHIQAMAQQLKAVADHSLRVHGPRYNNIILDVVVKVEA